MDKRLSLCPLFSEKVISHVSELDLTSIGMLMLDHLHIPVRRRVQVGRVNLFE